jgi:transposase
MKKGHQKITFKRYEMGQPMLLPPSLEELVPEEHLVRVVNRAVEAIEIEPLLKQYKGGGTSSYHPKMMLKVLVYAYTEKIYTSRRIAKALRENVNFMWISGGNRPDFRTINRFRGKVMKEVIDEVFTSVIEMLIEEGYIKLENYHVDGSTLEANANQHKVVWAKSVKRRKEQLREKIKELLEEIEAENEAEEEEYGDEDLEEMGGKGGIDAEKLKRKIEELNERLRNEPDNKPIKKAVQKLEKDYLPRQERYEEQEGKLNGRSSYSKTDEDAQSMRLKEDRSAEKPRPKPGYNVQAGTEGQFVVGFSVHQQPGDTAYLIPHLERLERQVGRLPENIIADAGYGSEENYLFLDEHHLGNYVKYNHFHRDITRHRKPKLIWQAMFRAEKLPYDEENDQFICPAQKRLSYLDTKFRRTKTGFLTRQRIYECSDCSNCPLKPDCTRTKGNRRIQVNFRLRHFRRQARDNLTSDPGVKLRADRSTDVETVFGDVKQNMQVRRFLLRGLKKVHMEWGLICIAHNMRKLAAQ